MNSQWLRRVRPKWSIGTLLIVVAWSSFVVWLNISPRIARKETFLGHSGENAVVGTIEYGCPWSYASVLAMGERLMSLPFRPSYINSYWELVGNIAVGMLAVAVLTLMSKYLLCRIVSGFKSRMVKRK